MRMPIKETDGPYAVPRTPPFFHSGGVFLHAEANNKAREGLIPLRTSLPLCVPQGHVSFLHQGKPKPQMKLSPAILAGRSAGWFKRARPRH